MDAYIPIDDAFYSELLGARQSLDVLSVESPDPLATSSIAYIDELYDLGATADLSHSGLRLRWLVATPRLDDVDPNPGWLSAAGWQVRVTGHRPTTSCLIVDGTKVFVPDLRPEPWDAYRVPITRHDTVARFQAHYDRLWADAPVVHHEDLLASSVPATLTRVLVASNARWGPIIAHLAMHPYELRTMDPREFEELVAELLIREGMGVHLTPRSNDGGRDVIASCETAVGRHLYVVECKRYAENRPVAVSWIRALYGIVEEARATAGILVTTSRFTKPALQWAEDLKYRLSLRDYEHLANWLRKIDQGGR